MDLARLVLLGVIATLVVGLGAPPTASASDTAYRDAVLADSPTAYYRLGEPAGFTSAASSAGTAPSLSLDAGSSIAFGAQGALRPPNIADTSAQFTSGSLRAAEDPAFLLVGGDWTIEFWMSATAANPSGWISLVSKFCQCGGQPWGYLVWLKPDSTIASEVYNPNPTAPYGVYGSTNVTDGKWHHIVVRRSGSTMEIYIDDVRDASAAVNTVGANDPSHLSAFRLSRQGTVSSPVGYPYVGTLDEVALYKSALSPSRIQAHYEAGKGAPVNLSPPGVSGTTQDGQTLSATTGSWDSPTAVSYGYQWQRCDSGGANCNDIAGATSSAYTLVSADVGSRIRVIVTATNAAGSSAAQSAPTGAVAAAPPTPDVGPTITGDVREGQTLATTGGSWAGSTPLTYAYQWSRCDPSGGSCTDIGGATTSTYGLTSDDVGHTMRVTETATNSAGSDSEVSPQTAVVMPAASPVPGQDLPTPVQQTVDGDLPATAESSIGITGNDSAGDYPNDPNATPTPSVTAEPGDPTGQQTAVGSADPLSGGDGNAFAPPAGLGPSPSASDGFACHVRGFAPYSRGNHQIAGTATNICDGPVTYQDVGACLQVIQRNNTFGDTYCTSNHRSGPGSVSVYVHSPCSGTFAWRVRANGHAIVNGRLYGATNFSPVKLLRCL